MQQQARALFELNCGSKIGTQNGTLVSGNMNQNLRSPGALILTQAHVPMWLRPPNVVGGHESPPKMMSAKGSSIQIHTHVLLICLDFTWGDLVWCGFPFFLDLMCLSGTQKVSTFFGLWHHLVASFRLVGPLAIRLAVRP